jgi:hypothetical protein
MARMKVTFRAGSLWRYGLKPHFFWFYKEYKEDEACGGDKIIFDEVLEMAKRVASRKMATVHQLQ